jgi:hypothetical protein
VPAGAHTGATAFIRMTFSRTILVRMTLSV